ncbi:hypothetical protein [Pleionea sp. CnH1-48]|uniref:hypothetical protein n=1 Tax=Pleionea sp. CnH1-48 TaxID=2954494 RepID=UPI002097C1F3|nr:hypothetical protein [Pleionea sp. CnH1-48]MCO7225598.1 hypothetical protein [Pleionea sp. CnH1-48]
MGPDEKVEAEVRTVLGRLISFLKSNYAFISALLLCIFYCLCAAFSTAFLLSFDIRFSLFTSFSSVIDIALANGIIPIIFSITMILSGTVWFTYYFIRVNYNKALTHQSKKGKIPSKKLTKNFEFIFPLLAIIFLLVVSIKATIMLLFSPTKYAQEIKDGFSERYSFETKNKRSYRCNAIIAGLSNYMILWNVEKKRPIIISRASITVAELVVNIPPGGWPVPPDRHDSDEDYRKKLIKYIETRKKWSTSLANECNQKVDWPDISELLEEYNLKEI